MNEAFDKHLKSNANDWFKLVDKGYITEDDLSKARNREDKYSYAEQNEAVKRLNDALSKVLRKFPNDPKLQQFISSMTEASDEMIKDKITSSFRDLDKVTDTDITLKAKKLGIPVDEFRQQFKLVKDRVDTEKGRERRKKELDEMAWYNPQKWATSDYEKQRYIDDPNTSFIGKEGKFNPYSKEGQMAISDAALGALGAFGDIIPGVGGIVIGPAARAARDINHVYNDSKFKKSKTEIAQDAVEDALFNVGADVLPTALTKYLPNVINKASDGDVGLLTDLALKANAYNEALKRSKTLEKDLGRFGYDKALDNVDKLKDMNFRDLKKAYNNTKDPTLKQTLNDAITRGKNGKTIIDIDKKKVEDIINDYWVSNKPGKLSDAWNKFGYNPDGKYTQNMKDMLEDYSGEWIEQQMNATEAGKVARGLAALERFWEKYGDRAYKSVGTTEQAPDVSIGPLTFGKRPSTKATRDDREDIDWFKDNYSRDWEAGFVPRGKDDEPIMKAYREWKEENKKPSVRSVLGGM